MIECARYQGWFHQSCARIPRTVTSGTLFHCGENVTFLTHTQRHNKGQLGEGERVKGIFIRFP